MAVEDLASAAISYAAAGWQVVPLYDLRDTGCTCPAGPACSSPGKHPCVKGGLKSASADVEVVAAWWQRFPNANIGIRTGAASGLLVVDVDAKDGAAEALADLDLPATAEVR